MREKKNYRTCVHDGKALFLAFFTFLLVMVPIVSRADSKISPDVLRFGIFPYKSPKTLIDMYGPLAACLEKKLGKKVQLVSAPDATSFFEQVKDGGYDIIIPSVTMYYKLRPVGYKVIAMGVPGFYGGIIVRKDSGITSIAQLKGKKVVAQGEFASAYLSLLPQLAAEGIVPHKNTNIQFAGKVDSLVYGVLSKKYDVAIMRLDTLDASPLDEFRDQFTILLRSSEIPQFPIAVKTSMDEDMIAIIRKTFTALSPDIPEELTLLKSLQIKKIIAATDADYQDFYEKVKGSDYFQQP